MSRGRRPKDHVVEVTPQSEFSILSQRELLQAGVSSLTQENLKYANNTLISDALQSSRDVSLMCTFQHLEEPG